MMRPAVLWSPETSAFPAPFSPRPADAADRRCSLRFADAGWVGPDTPAADASGPSATSARVRSVALRPGWRCLLLDSTVPSSHGNEEGRAVSGEFGLAEVEAVRAELALAEERGEKAVVVLHHPMEPPGSGWEGHCLNGDGAAALEALLAESPAVEAVVGGHLHAPLEERVGDGDNAMMLVAPSSCHQYLKHAQGIKLDTESMPGWREIVLGADGSWSTAVYRLNADQVAEGMLANANEDALKAFLGRAP